MRLAGSILAGFLATMTVGHDAHADFHYGKSWPRSWHRKPHPGHNQAFRRIATLPNFRNNADIGAETVSEIVAVTKDGNTLIYTDGTLEEVGFVDISNPEAPLGVGKLAVGGEPTSVATLGSQLALVGVNTSASFEDPSGNLAVVDIPSRQIVATLRLGGQPDSVAVSPDRRYAAVAIENERDEDVVVDGEEGGLPQLPGGTLAIVDLQGPPDSWHVRFADLTGLSAYAPTDPEPEFVDINDRNQAVVSMQENNHIAVVDLCSGNVVQDFSAGTVTLVDVDGTEDDLISLTETLVDVPREPDAVTWLKQGRHRLIGTANEGDLFGGSRGFSLFTASGVLVYDSGSLLEELAVRNGHYPESRSENKGTEPEAIEYARFGKRDYLFVGSERGSFVAVFELKAGQEPEFVQLLPAPLGPEGLLAIPSRGLLVASGESDDPSYGVRSSMMIYKLGAGEPDYPQILSGDDEFGQPIAWSALSGMTALPQSKDQLLAVWDSYYGESRIFNIDAAQTPAVITDATTIVGGTGNFDPEGIAVAPDGTYWIASEGNATNSRLNRLLQVTPGGSLLQEVNLPADITACRAASSATGSLGSGFEGVAVWRQAAGYSLAVAQQRGWNYTTPECEALDDDPADIDANEPGFSRIWIYSPAAGTWESVAYELEPKPANASWVGLSEITAVKDGFIVIERDNRTGDFAQLKTLVKFTMDDLRDGMVSRSEKRVFDLLPALNSTHGLVSDKPEGVAVTANNRLFVVTDNDGVDDWSGETWFMDLGRYPRLFR